MSIDSTITDIQTDKTTITEAVRLKIHIINITIYNFKKEITFSLR